jgi:hypothetical protein
VNDLERMERSSRRAWGVYFPQHRSGKPSARALALSGVRSHDPRVFPEILRIGGEDGVAVSTRFVLHGIAFAVWLFLVVRRRPDLLVDPRKGAALLLFAAGGGLLANVMVATIEARSVAYSGNFLSWCLGAVGGIVLFCRSFRQPLGDLLDALAPPTLLASAIGRVGCFCEGCCHGIAGSGFFAVHFGKATHGPGWYYPTQLLNAALDLLAFAIATVLARKRTLAPGRLACVCGLLYAAFRFPVEWVRAEETFVAGWTRGQVLSAVLATVSLAVLALGRPARRPAPVDR